MYDIPGQKCLEDKHLDGETAGITDVKQPCRTIKGSRTEQPSRRKTTTAKIGRTMEMQRR